MRYILKGAPAVAGMAMCPQARAHPPPCPGGPERWRVIGLSCGGQHTVALALPDNGENGPRGRAPLLSVSGASPDTSSVEGASEEEVGANLDDCLDVDDDGDEDLSM